MTDDQILEVIGRYEQALINDGIPTIAHTHELNCVFPRAALAHLRTMFPKIRGFVSDGRREEAMRSLRFIQGVLWSCGLASLDELEDDNR